MKLQSHSDPAMTMSGQVGSQVKMIVGTNWLIANVRTMKADESGEVVAYVDFLGEGTRDAAGKMSNFRRGVTRYPVPGCQVHPVSTEDLRSIFAASDEAHVEIGTVYPTDDIRGALPEKERRFEAGLLDRRRRHGLYAENPQGVEISGGVLYRATIAIPSQVPVGTYTAETFLIDRGKVIAAATRDIQIDKSGFERFVALAARRHEGLYGIAAVLMSLGMGWAAAAFFRRRM
jgi:hypothetical protein